MFFLLLPYVIGVALGIDPPVSGDVAQAEAAVAAPADAAGTDDGTKSGTKAGDALATGTAETAPAAAAPREPEPQIATGKFTTAVEIRTILAMTKSNWVAVRPYEGQDLLYFTHLLSWRCGLWDIRYGVNGAAATETVPMEPCHEDMATPNAMTDSAGFLPYVSLPADSVDSVYVEITYDDGTTDFAQFNRNEVLIP